MKPIAVKMGNVAVRTEADEDARDRFGGGGEPSSSDASRSFRALRLFSNFRPAKVASLRRRGTRRVRAGYSRPRAPKDRGAAPSSEPDDAAAAPWSRSTASTAAASASPATASAAFAPWTAASQAPQSQASAGPRRPPPTRCGASSAPEQRAWHLRRAERSAAGSAA